MRTPQFSPNDIIESFARKIVISKAELLREHGCSPMTLWRLLRQAGYVTSYNYNAKYCTLAATPQFDDDGLWAYQDIRFSKWGTLRKSVVAVVEHSSSGMTAREVEELLQVRNAKPLLTNLVLNGELWRETVDRFFVYLAVEQSRQEQQFRQRKEHAVVLSLPEPQRIIALLVEMIRHPRQTPLQWAQRLARHNIRLGTQDIRAVMEHYHLSVKKGL